MRWPVLLVLLVGMAEARAACHTGGCLHEMDEHERTRAIAAKERADRVMTGVLLAGGSAFLGVLGYQFWRERRDFRE